MIEYELADGNEMTCILLLIKRKNEILKKYKFENNIYKEEINNINKNISILINNMLANKYDRKITIECKGLSSQEIMFIYRYLNELCKEDKRIEYYSSDL